MDGKAVADDNGERAARLLRVFPQMLQTEALNGLIVRHLAVVPHLDQIAVLNPARIRIVRMDPKTYFSYGSALLVNTRIFRIGTDFQLGIRYSHPNIPGKWGRIQFIFQTGL